jgi:hypothetical protein
LIPPLFLPKSGRYSPAQSAASRRVTHHRQQIERVIRKFNHYAVLQHRYPLSALRSLNSVVYVIGCLVALWTHREVNNAHGRTLLADELDLSVVDGGEEEPAAVQDGDQLMEVDEMEEKYIERPDHAHPLHHHNEQGHQAMEEKTDH